MRTFWIAWCLAWALFWAVPGFFILPIFNFAFAFGSVAMVLVPVGKESGKRLPPPPDNRQLW